MGYGCIFVFFLIKFGFEKRIIWEGRRKKEEGGGGVGKEKGMESCIGERKEVDCVVVGIGGIWWWRVCIC